MKGKTMPFHPANPVVWTEIPVRDLTAAQNFYQTVLGIAMNRSTMDGFEMVDFKAATQSGVSGHLYVGEPAVNGAGPTVHLAIPDKVEAALDRVRAAGGRVISPVITIPPGRFAKIEDPDGNSIGLFEPA
jgi:uncharacterized protein